MTNPSKNVMSALFLFSRHVDFLEYNTDFCTAGPGTSRCRGPARPIRVGPHDSGRAHHRAQALCMAPSLGEVRWSPNEPRELTRELTRDHNRSEFTSEPRILHQTQIQEPSGQAAPYIKKKLLPIARRRRLDVSRMSVL